jgi:hypothetical protein
VSERVPDAAESGEHEEAPVQSAPPSRPADGALKQSPPGAAPPPRSGLAEKARARPRAAADVAREAAAADGSEDDRRRGSATPAVERAEKADGAAGKSVGTTRPGARSGRKADDPPAGVERERPGGPWPMPARSLMATVLGVHPAAAVGVAAALTAVGVAIDLLRVGTLSTAFAVCYLTGCVLATAWVRRSGVFWPMVAPPLLMAVAVPVVVLVAGTPRPGAGIAQRLLMIGAPLVNGFPMMAWTTGLVLALGLFRLVTQRVNPGRGAARAGGRTSASPRR